MTTVEVPNEAELRELGFEQAAEQMKSDRELAKKLRIAFEHFRVVKPEHITRFGEELKNNTLKSNQYSYSFDRIKFTPISQYRQVPPKEALDKIRDAKKLGCFDSFEVATIKSVKVVPDPVVFGIINGSTNKYFVCQWDEDLKIEQILKEDEG